MYSLLDICVAGCESAVEIWSCAELIVFTTSTNIPPLITSLFSVNCIEFMFSHCC